MFNGMAAKKITEAQLREYVQALVPDNEEAENTARTENIRNSVLQLHDSGLRRTSVAWDIVGGFQQRNRIHGPHDVGWRFDHAIEFNMVWSRRAIKVEGVPFSGANDASLIQVKQNSRLSNRNKRRTYHEGNIFYISSGGSGSSAGV